MAYIVATDPGGGTEVFSAINAAYTAAQDGDIIDCRHWVTTGGDRTFSGVLNMTKKVSFEGPGMSLVFKRKETDSDATVLGWLYMFRYNINSDIPCNIKFSGVTLKSKIPSANTGADGFSMVADRGLGFTNAVDFRVTNCRFENFGDGGLEIRHRDHLARGLVDNCVFYHNYKGSTGLGLGYGITVYGEGLNWYPHVGFTLGGPDFIFIEDCNFQYHRHSVATAGGSRHVVRYCSFDYQVVPQSHCVDTHDSRGPGNGTNTFGSRAWEFYNNTIVNTTFLNGTPIAPGSDMSNIQERAIGAISGDGVIHNNVCSGYRFMIGYRQTTSTTANYPFLQQVGWISGRRKGLSDTGADIIAADGDVWEWNNTFTPYVSSPVNSSQKNFIYSDIGPDGNYNAVDREYHSAVKPNYTPYTYPHPNRLI